jgi:hypothetical protein
MSRPGKETVASQHFEARDNIRLVIRTLFAEDKISRITFDYINGQIELIRADPYALLLDLMGHDITFIADGEEFTGRLEIKKLQP